MKWGRCCWNPVSENGKQRTLYVFIHLFRQYIRPLRHCIQTALCAQCSRTGRPEAAVLNGVCLPQPGIDVQLQTGEIVPADGNFLRTHHRITGIVRVVHREIGVLRHNVHRNALCREIGFQQQAANGKPEVHFPPQLRQHTADRLFQFCRIVYRGGKFRQCQPFQLLCDICRNVTGTDAVPDPAGTVQI